MRQDKGVDISVICLVIWLAAEMRVTRTLRSFSQNANHQMISKTVGWIFDFFQGIDNFSIWDNRPLSVSVAAFAKKMVSAICEIIDAAVWADLNSCYVFFELRICNFETTVAEFLKKLWDGQKNM